MAKARPADLPLTRTARLANAREKQAATLPSMAENALTAQSPIGQAAPLRVIHKGAGSTDNELLRATTALIYARTTTQALLVVSCKQARRASIAAPNHRLRFGVDDRSHSLLVF